MSRFVPTWYLIVCIVASTVALAIGGIVYTNYAIEGSEIRQCEEIQAEVQYYVENPPDSERTRGRQEFYQDRYEEICAERQ